VDATAAAGGARAGLVLSQAPGAALRAPSDGDDEMDEDLIDDAWADGGRPAVAVGPPRGGEWADAALAPAAAAAAEAPSEAELVEARGRFTELSRRLGFSEAVSLPQDLAELLEAVADNSRLAEAWENIDGEPPRAACQPALRGGAG
ncbi:unnamed protein product, partial [Prorocentrum cordatum]